MTATIGQRAIATVVAERMQRGDSVRRILGDLLTVTCDGHGQRRGSKGL